jgi:nitrogen fixation protein NifQ
MTGYTDTIRRYAIDCRRSGPLEDADGTGEVGLGAGEAGKRLAVRFALRADGGRAEAVRFQVFGCGFTIAACAAAAELAEGRALEEILDLSASDIDAALGGLPPERGYCADLAVEALHAAVTSALGDARAVRAAVNPLEDHGPRVGADDPVYGALMAATPPDGVPQEDRHLFACLLAVAAGEPHETAAALGLAPGDLDAILLTYFPGIDRTALERLSAAAVAPPPEPNDEVLAILFSHVPKDADAWPVRAAHLLARIIAARAAHPGHLWVAMGLSERPELTAAIGRHLPSLAAANSKGMRWKRYLFKQVCDLHGAVLCKSPNCGVCSDYSLCFEPQE